MIGRSGPDRRGFSINIFLADGVPEGLRIVEKGGWTGKALICSRAQFPEVKKRPEFRRPGVYILIGEETTTSSPTIYIGEGDPVVERLEKHYREKDFWVRLIVFTSTDGHLHKTNIQYLESRLIELASSAKRSKFNNRNNSNLPSLSEASQAEMENFLLEMKLVCATMGISFFEVPKISEANGLGTRLHLKVKSADALGYNAIEGFIVLKGSKVETDETPSLQDGYRSLRQDLKNRGVLTELAGRLVFSQDYAFSSPSSAASVVTGRSCNGQTEWKSENGIPLKKLEEVE